MKRSRVALFLFMATFASSLLTAGFADDRSGPFAPACGAESQLQLGRCEYAYDRPSDPCDAEDATLDMCEFAGSPRSHVGTMIDRGIDAHGDCFEPIDDADLHYGPVVSEPAPHHEPATIAPPVTSTDDNAYEPYGSDGAAYDYEFEGAYQPTPAMDHVDAACPVEFGPCTRFVVEPAPRSCPLMDNPWVQELALEISRAASHVLAEFGRTHETFIRQQSTAVAWGSTLPMVAGAVWHDRERMSMADAVFAAGLAPTFDVSLHIPQQWAGRALAPTTAAGQAEVLRPVVRMVTGLWNAYGQAIDGLSESIYELASQPHLFTQPAVKAAGRKHHTRTSLHPSPRRFEL
jgi:hypothetical protein